MKRKATIILTALFVIAGIFAVSPFAQSYTYDTIEKLLNRMVESSADENSIKVEFVNTVSDFSVHNETALTNTVDPTFQIRHTTTGTPANGIGLSMDFKQETAASNEEILARLAVVTTDVTAASEDAKLDFMMMTAGAAAATKMSLGSTGILTLAGSATIDNATSATNLAIAETNIGLTGILTVTGATTINGATVINDASADADTRIESNGNENAIFVDAGNDRVGIFTAAPTVPFDVTGQSLFTGAMGVVGAVTVTGDTVLDGGLIVNEGSADKDVRIETNDVSDAFVVDGGANFVQIGTWAKYDYIATTDQSYSLSSTGRASNIIQTVDGEDGTLHLMTALLTSPGAGAVITIKTGNTQTVTIDTEGDETIDGGATYALDANYEAVTLTNNGSNWFVLSGYLE